VWGGEAGPTMAGYNLVCGAKRGLAAKGLERSRKKALDQILADMQAHDPALAKYKNSTLRRICFLYWDSPAPLTPKESMIPQCISAAHKLGLWGDDAQKLVAELVAAAGSDELAVVELFKLAAKKKHYSDRQKIDWLWKQVPELKKNQDYRPVRRVDKEDRPKRDLVLKIIRDAPNRRADISFIRRKTGWTRDSVAKLVQYLKEDGEIICTEKPGMFTLQGLGAPHVTAREAVRALMAPSGKEWTIEQLVRQIGGGRGRIDSALFNLKGEGDVACPRRGVYKWAAR